MTIREELFRLHRRVEELRENMSSDAHRNELLRIRAELAAKMRAYKESRRLGPAKGESQP